LGRAEVERDVSWCLFRSSMVSSEPHDIESLSRSESSHRKVAGSVIGTAGSIRIVSGDRIRHSSLADRPSGKVVSF